MAAKVHCESSRQLGFALSYTRLLPSNGEKTVFMVTSGLFFFLVYFDCTRSSCHVSGRVKNMIKEGKYDPSEASKARNFSCLPLGNRTNVTLAVRSSAGYLWRASNSSLWHWRVFLNSLLVKQHCPAWLVFHYVAWRNRTNFRHAMFHIQTSYLW